MTATLDLGPVQLSLDDMVDLAVRVVVVIPCSAEKRQQDRDAGVYAFPAGDLYLGTFHRYARQHAERIGADEILILSAAEGLIDLDRLVPPYDKKITDKDSIVATPGKVAHQAQVHRLLDPGTVVVSLCPAAYTRELRRAVPDLVAPLEGSRGIGEQRGRIRRLTRAEVLA